MDLLLVDDEELARQRLRDLLAGLSGVRVVGEATGGGEAVRQIGQLNPDVILLDIQMPDLDGFQVLERVGPEKMPLTIFVTAFDAFALRAFEVAAVDYLLKPFDRHRLVEALERARSRLAAAPAAADPRITTLLQLVEERRQLPSMAGRLLVPDGQGQRVLAFDQIHHVEGAGNYVRIHTDTESFLLRDTLASLETRLDAGNFARVHRSSIVNLDRVQRVEPWFSGDLVAILEGGRTVRVSRSYADGLRQRLGG